METKTKQEYVVYAIWRWGSDIYYHTFSYDNGIMKKMGNAYHSVPYRNLYPTKEDAMKQAQECIDKEVFVDLGAKAYGPFFVESNSQAIKIATQHPSRYCVIVMQVPLGYYIGYDYADMLAFIGNDSYSDDAPYQLTAFRKGDDLISPDRFLLYKGKNDFEWIDDRWQASFFDKETAEKVAEYMNHQLPKEKRKHAGYVRVRADLPLRLETEPKWKKGDVVYALFPHDDYIPYTSCKTAYKCEVVDMMVARNKKGEKVWEYAVNAPTMYSLRGYYDETMFTTATQIKAKGGVFSHKMFNGRRQLMLSYNGVEYCVYAYNK